LTPHTWLCVHKFALEPCLSLPKSPHTGAAQPLTRSTCPRQEAKARLEQSQQKKERDALDRATKEQAREEEEQKRADAERQLKQQEAEELEQQRVAREAAAKRRYKNLRWMEELERTQTDQRQFLNEERRDQQLKLDRHRGDSKKNKFLEEVALRRGGGEEG